MYNTHCFPLQQRLQVRASMLRFTYNACLFFLMQQSDEYAYSPILKMEPHLCNKLQSWHPRI